MRSGRTVSEKVQGCMRIFMELFGYRSNLNPLSILDESPTTKSRREKGCFIRPLEPVQGESH
jgi:hypothetical protein